MTDDLLLPSKVVLCRNTIHEYEWNPYKRAQFWQRIWREKEDLISREGYHRWLMTDCYRAWLAGGHDLMERFRLNAIVGMES